MSIADPLGRETSGKGKLRRWPRLLLPSSISNKSNSDDFKTESPLAAGKKCILAIKHKVFLMFASTAREAT